MRPAIFMVIIVIMALCLSGCSTLNRYGIGGPPRLVCAAHVASIDDRIAGSDDMHLSLVRRFTDGDTLCGQKQIKYHSEGRMDH